MNRQSFQRIVAGVVLISSMFMPASAADVVSSDSESRFGAIHIQIDSGNVNLAAYQVAIKATSGTVKIVGIEGGSHEAFKNPPFYDPKAMQKDEVILAAFSLNAKSQLPSGETRVATIHYQVGGRTEAAFEIKLQAAANADGKRIEPKVSVKKGTP